MTMDELKKMCKNARAKRETRISVDMNLSKLPESVDVNVAGFGAGIITHIKSLPDGSINCACSFNLETVEKNITRYEMGKKFK